MEKPKLTSEQRERKRISGVVVRYSVLILIGLLAFSLFYTIFAPLTISPAFALFRKFFKEAILSGSSIFFDSITLNIADSCVSGAAYYLLTIFNLTTPMPFVKRITSLLFSYALFLALNILRIFFFALFFVSSFNIYSLAHFISWYFLSTLIVFAVWLTTIKLFKITDIPVYTDFKFLYAKTHVKHTRNTKI